MKPTEKQRRQIIGRVAEIGTRVVFEFIFFINLGGGWLTINREVYL